MSNPFLDEIPEVCISDEMHEQIIRERIYEDFNRMKELEDLRNYRVKGYDDIVEHSQKLKKLGHKYYLKLSSTVIIKRFLHSHITAYEHCMQKARTKLGEVCMIKNSKS